MNYKKIRMPFWNKFFRTEELNTVTTYTQNGITNQTRHTNQTMTKKNY